MKEDIPSLRTASNQDKTNAGRGKVMLHVVCHRQERTLSCPLGYKNLSAPSSTARYGLWFGRSWTPIREKDGDLAAAGSRLPSVTPWRLKKPARQGSGSQQAILRGPGRRGYILSKHGKQSLSKGTG